MNPILAMQGQSFPRTDWGQPQLILCTKQFGGEMLAESMWFQSRPQPDVSIQKQLQSRRTSQSSGSVAGEMMSPRISPWPFMEPSQFPRSLPGDGGTTSATGFPKRVMRIGFFVLRTCSKMARHLALNSEIYTSSMVSSFYYGQSKWSKQSSVVCRQPAMR